MLDDTDSASPPATLGRVVLLAFALLGYVGVSSMLGFAGVTGSLTAFWHFWLPSIPADAAFVAGSCLSATVGFLLALRRRRLLSVFVAFVIALATYAGSAFLLSGPIGEDAGGTVEFAVTLGLYGIVFAAYAPLLAAGLWRSWPRRASAKTQGAVAVAPNDLAQPTVVFEAMSEAKKLRSILLVIVVTVIAAAAFFAVFFAAIMALELPTEPVGFIIGMAGLYFAAFAPLLIVEVWRALKSWRRKARKSAPAPVQPLPNAARPEQAIEFEIVSESESR